MNQRDLFDWGLAEPLSEPPEPPEPSGELPGPPAPDRRSSDCEAILGRLRRGPATNLELQELVMGYRQRISDLRKKGYRITNRRAMAGGGRISIYRLGDRE